MCKTVFINRGEKEISTPREFKNHFGFEPVKDELFSLVEDEKYSEKEMDECLCSANILKTLRMNEIPFKTYWGDVYVGELDFIEVI